MNTINNHSLKTRNYVGDIMVCDHIVDSIRHAVHYKTYHSRYEGR